MCVCVSSTGLSAVIRNGNSIGNSIGILMGTPLEFSWEFYWNSIGSLMKTLLEFEWKFYWNSNGIVLKFHRNSIGIPSSGIVLKFHRSTTGIPLELYWNDTGAINTTPKLTDYILPLSYILQKIRSFPYPLLIFTHSRSFHKRRSAA